MLFKAVTINFRLLSDIAIKREKRASIIAFVLVGRAITIWGAMQKKSVNQCKKCVKNAAKRLRAKTVTFAIVGKR